jgi:hypothetical protein
MAATPLAGKQSTPGAVGDDHQLGDQLVERAAALARGNVDPAGLGVADLAVDPEVVVEVSLHRRWLAAPAFAGIGQLPEGHQLVAKGEVGEAAGDRLLVEQRFDVVVAQVGDDRNDLDARLMGNDLELRASP